MPKESYRRVRVTTLQRVKELYQEGGLHVCSTTFICEGTPELEGYCKCTTGTLSIMGMFMQAISEVHNAATFELNYLRLLDGQFEDSQEKFLAVKTTYAHHLFLEDLMDEYIGFIERFLPEFDEILGEMYDVPVTTEAEFQIQITKFEGGLDKLIQKISGYRKVMKDIRLKGKKSQRVEGRKQPPR